MEAADFMEFMNGKSQKQDTEFQKYEEKMKSLGWPNNFIQESYIRITGRQPYNYSGV